MRVSFLILLMLPVFAIAQDVLIKRDGKEVKTRILRIEKKQITYKLIDDPEFQTLTVDKKDVRMIRMETGKVYDFDRELPAPYVGLGGGAFIPTGKFQSSRSGEGYTPGYAQMGYNIKVSAGFYIKKKIGIPIEFNLRNSDYSDENQLNNIQSPNSSITSITFDGGAYSFYTVHTGLMYSTYLGSKKKAVIDMKLHGGLMHISERVSKISYRDANGIELLSSTTTYNSKGFLSYGGGINFRYLLSKRIGLCLNADMVMATPELNYNRVTNDVSGFGNDLQPANSSIVRTISGVSTGLSLYYHFNRRKE